ncbi:hypothetical protein [Streptomyces sp. AC495_CC817]|uniref:hypothetical protein n=1 Tax=Streptomyces sp. AC495_CC817 TaxID=2823900 RepID=UPI001C263235|nr:hypothetical protein [Streptomyces sp. AC495_CC817]
MSGEVEAVTGPGGGRGRTTITARALHRLATGVAGETARVPAREVSMDLSDAGGALRAAVVVPVALAEGDSIPLAERADGLRRAVIGRMDELAGRRVVAVDVRFAGVHTIREGRAR